MVAQTLPRFKSRRQRTRTHPSVCGRNVVPQHCARKPFFTLTALKSGDFHEAQDKSLKHANALLSLKIRLELSTVVRICVADPTLLPQTFFHGSRNEQLVLLRAFLRNPFSPGRTFWRSEAGGAARADPDTPVSPHSLLHGRSSVHGLVTQARATRRHLAGMRGIEVAEGIRTVELRIHAGLFLEFADINGDRIPDTLVPFFPRVLRRGRGDRHAYREGCTYGLLICPACRTVKIVGILHELARPPIRRHEENTHAHDAAGEHHHFAQEQRLPHSRIEGCRIVPSPDDPCERLVNAAAAPGAEQRFAECGLIFKLGRDELSGREVHYREHQKTETGRPPVVPAEVRGRRPRAVQPYCGVQYRSPFLPDSQCRSPVLFARRIARIPRSSFGGTLPDLIGFQLRGRFHLIFTVTLKRRRFFFQYSNTGT